MRVPTLDEVLACPNLPTLPTVALEVLELTRNEGIKLKEIARVVQHDPALATKILRTVNSSYYGLAKPCPSIQRALAYLGLSTVKSLVLGFSLVDLTRQSGGKELDLIAYWRRCLYSAVAARRLTDRVALCEPDLAFVAALMQDVGMLAMYAVAPDVYSALAAKAGADHNRLPRIERARLGYDHTEVGAALTERWRLPGQLVEAIRHHHEAGMDARTDVMRSVVLSNQIADALTVAEPAEMIADITKCAEAWLRLSPPQMLQLMQTIAEDAAALSELFDVNLGDLPDVNRILAEAEEASLRHQLAVQKETESLRRTNDRLARQATTDALTNIGNRKRFDEELAHQFQQARAFKGSLGLLLVDIDHFKRVNDIHGHQTGDGVLVELAQRLQRVVRDGDTVCRYGGEEFAVVLPGASLTEISAIGERLRLVAVATPFEPAKPSGAVVSLNVTVSVGGAAMDAETSSVILSSDLLVRAADKALYAAKNDGRDCVRTQPAPPQVSAA